MSGSRSADFLPTSESARYLGRSLLNDQQQVVDEREVIVLTGHKNPDMDSICSSLAYAKLKNFVEPEYRFVAISTGINDLTRRQLEKLGVTPPIMVNDIRPNVATVMRLAPVTLQISDPVLAYCELHAARGNLDFVALLDGRDYAGMLRYDAVTSWFIGRAIKKSPIVEYDMDNISKVLRGTWLKRGPRIVKSTFALGMMKLDRYREELERRSQTGILPIVILTERRRHVQVAVEKNVPAIILVGIRDSHMFDAELENYKGSVFLASEATADQACHLVPLSVPLRSLLGDQPPSVDPGDDFDVVRDALAKSPHTAFPVVVGASLLGVVTRNEFLKKPRRKVIMMDHNEEAQSVPGLDSADIYEIIDHHRFAPPRTQVPIFVDCEPLGSTCTLVYRLYRRHDVELDMVTARLLLSGLLNDTMGLRSPTTTPMDIAAAEKLSRIGHVNLQKFGDDLSSGQSLEGQDPNKLVGSDFKEFDECGFRFGIGQCEVGTFRGLGDVKPVLIETLKEFASRLSLEFCALVVTNVSAEGSVILILPHRVTSKLHYKALAADELDAPGVLSRKVQVLPEFVRALRVLSEEEAARAK